MRSNAYGPTVIVHSNATLDSSLMPPESLDSPPPAVIGLMTWEWVLMQLAAVILSWVGKKILDELFPAPGNGPVFTLEQFFELIEKTMRGALSEYDVRLLTRRYESLVQNVKEYSASGGQHRLDHADLDVNELIIGFKSYGDTTADLLASAELFKIAIFQVYTKEGIRDETENIKERASEFVTDLTAAAATRLRLIHSYYGLSPIIRYPGRGEMVEYGYLYKGDFVPEVFCWPSDRECTSNARSTADRARVAAKDRELKQRYQPFLDAIAILQQLPALP